MPCARGFAISPTVQEADTALTFVAVDGPSAISLDAKLIHAGIRILDDLSPSFINAK